MKTETYTVIDSYELEELVRVNLGVHDYNYVADVEANNDSWQVYDPRVHIFGPNSEFEMGYREWIREADDGGWASVTLGYLGKLVEKGIIPEDKLILVGVCW